MKPLPKTPEAIDAHARARERVARSPRPLRRHERVRDFKPSPIIAYDFETTRIAVGTPRPVYLTAFHPSMLQLAGPIRSMPHLRDILRGQFLTPENSGARFVAWNANNFDAYFVAAALIECEDLVIRPYLTKSKALRGMRISLACDLDRNNKGAPFWEFTDGMSMLGLQGVSLSKFLANFAPDHRKLSGVIDFEAGEEFDADNPAHVDYAMRDSVGLWHGMQRAQSILIERFNQGLGVTMGGACIKIFKANIPDDVSVPTPRAEVLTLTREFVMRGGYCYCVQRFDGPVWKYDLNQAYAAAMREARLPQGFTQRMDNLPEGDAPYIARVSASLPGNKVPFYYRTEIAGRVRSAFSADHIADTWLTSIEVDQLRVEGWRIDVRECWAWQSSFSMRDYVDKLEAGRMTCEGGPSGPIGTMLKMVGNHSYGKTVEQIEPLEFILAKECPPTYAPYYGDEFEPIEHTFFRFVEDQDAKDYHQPQLGAFITAHVRMVVRRAALIDPDAWLYADTDCVVFSRDVTASLDIDPARYGAWKIEEAGTRYQIIAKKVYAQAEGEARKRSAKGMNVKRLSADDFTRWLDGAPPVQTQVQRNNFLAVLQGAEMFRAQVRTGTGI